MAPRDLAKLQDANVDMDSTETEAADPIRDRHLLLYIKELDVRSQMVFLVRALGRASWAEIASVLSLRKRTVRKIFETARATLFRLIG